MFNGSQRSIAESILARVRQGLVDTELDGYVQDVCICGGFARDSYVGVAYKDVDVFVCIGPDVEEHLAAEAQRLGIFENSNLTIRQAIPSYNGASTDFDERINSVLKVRDKWAPHTEYDIIFSRCRNRKEVLESFDYRFNQCYYDEDSRDFKVYEAFDFVQLKPVRTERTLYMREKFEFLKSILDINKGDVCSEQITRTEKLLPHISTQAVTTARWRGNSLTSGEAPSQDNSLAIGRHS